MVEGTCGAALMQERDAGDYPSDEVFYVNGLGHKSIEAEVDGHHEGVLSRRGYLWKRRDENFRSRWQRRGFWEDYLLASY